MKKVLIILAFAALCLYSDAQNRVVYKSYTYVGAATKSVIKDVTIDWAQQVKTIDSLKAAISIYKSIVNEPLKTELDNYIRVLPKNYKKGSIFTGQSSKLATSTDRPLTIFISALDGDSIRETQILKFEK
jgi:hypothetical protein